MEPFRYFKKVFRKNQRLNSKKPKPDRNFEKFFSEIQAYRASLARSVAHILGDQEGLQVIDTLNRLENEGAYVTDPEIMRSLGAFFASSGEDLGFYVITTHDSGIKLSIDDHGIRSDRELALQARPVFLFRPEGSSSASSKVQTETEYIFPWVFEFGHFLCYWMQDRPLTAAMGLVSGALEEQGVDIRSFDDLSEIGKVGLDKIAWNLVRMHVQWRALNEAMAIWWAEKLLTHMGFEIDDSLTRKKAGNPYADQIESLTDQRAIDYIRYWNNPMYYGEDFTKAFVESFAAIEIDKWGFLDDPAEQIFPALTE